MTAVQAIPVEAALDGTTVRAASATTETAVALRTRATCATGHRNKAFTFPLYRCLQRTVTRITPAVSNPCSLR